MGSTILYVIQVNIFITGILLCYRYLLKRDIHFRFARLYLLSGAVLALLLPFLHFNNEIIMIETNVLNEVIISPIKDSISSASDAISVYTVLITIYFSGMLLLLMEYFRRFYRIKQLIKKSKKSGNYYSLPNGTEAFSFFHFIFLGDLIPTVEKEMIFKHEKVHSDKYHSVDILFCHLLECLFWFNPFVYQLKTRLKEVHEYEADAICCRSNTDYIDLLLKQKFNQFELSFIHPFNSTHLKQRIMRINNQSPLKMKPRNMLIAAAVISGLFLFNQQLNSAEIGQNKELKRGLVHKSLEEKGKAQFPGGQKALIKFMQENVKYPKEIKGQDVAEKILIEFTVGKDGKVSDPKLIKGKNEHLIKAAMAAVNKMPNWNPAEKDGKKVASKIVLPFQFVPPPAESETPPVPPTPPSAPEAPKPPKNKTQRG